MQLAFGETLRTLRKDKNQSQEQIAQTCGVSVQAVSKWENNLSYPDITLLPTLADLFDVSIDYLLRGKQEPQPPAEVLSDVFPDDGVLRIVQYRGNRLLDQKAYQKMRANDVKMPLQIEEEKDGIPVKIEIWGSADIQGGVNGDLNAGDSVNCGGVGGNVNAGDGVNCGGVGGNVSAGDGVNCGSVGLNVSAGDGVNCGNVGENVSAGDSVNCGSIGGDASAGDNIKCMGDINGDVKVKGDLRCKVIHGSVECEGNVIYES